MTHGAGASSREGTYATVALLRENGFNAIPHISWGNDSDEKIISLLHSYEELGVEDLVLLRGDKPEEGADSSPARYGEDLVRLVRSTFKDRFVLHVACYPEKHPEAATFSSDLRHLANKVKAGADACITQYFFNPDAYTHFLKLCAERDIAATMIPGLMPISNYAKLVSFSEKCGAEIPRWLQERLAELESQPDALRTFGTDVLVRLILSLVGQGVSGIHFYTLNLARPTQAILDRLLID